MQNLGGVVREMCSQTTLHQASPQRALGHYLEILPVY